MTASGTSRSWATRHPRIVTLAISLVAYTVVLASFTDLVSLPALDPATVNLFSDLIAVINTVALTVLILGVVFIRRGDVDRHRRAMLTAFGLISLFLVLYVWKQAGGFTKGLVVADGQFLAGYAGLVSGAYLVMLAIHVILSIVAVPFVIHALVLGSTQPVETLPETLHPTVGRIAVAAWTTSLALGILTYLMLNHVYSWERVRGIGLLLVIGTRSARPTIRAWLDRLWTGLLRY